MLELFIKLEHETAVKRPLRFNNAFEMLSRIAEAAQETSDKFESNVMEICVTQTKFAKTRSPLTVHNICGKVYHPGSQDAWQPGVKECLRTVYNDFGKFTALYSQKTNLLMSSSGTNTLFRGGNRSCDISEVLFHAIKPGSVVSITVHMIVANGFLPWSLVPTSKSLDRSVQTNSNWTLYIDECMEKESFQKQMRLHSFDQNFCAEIIGNISPPLSLLMNLSRHGNVNLFLGLSPSTSFYNGVELMYLPFMQYFLDLLSKHT